MKSIDKHLQAALESKVGLRKIGRNQSCPCLSGKKHKKCCGGIAPPPRLPAQAVVNQARAAVKFDTCLHPDSSPTRCEAIINAHTVQRKSSLESIVDASNKVLTFHEAERYSGAVKSREPKLIGWKEASVFRGFCKLHDAMFSPVEVLGSEPTKSNCFLLTFRALCYELYNKKGAVEAYPTLLPLLHRHLTPDNRAAVLREKFLINCGSEKSLSDITRLKAVADVAWREQDLKDWEFCVLELTGEVCLTASGRLTPYADFGGRYLQNLAGPDMLQILFVNVVRGDSGPRIVFGWHRAATAARRYVESLLRVPQRIIPTIISQILFAHIQNTYFSASWWQSLSESSQAWVTVLADCSPYVAHPGYRTAILVPWTVTRVTWL